MGPCYDASSRPKLVTDSEWLTASQRRLCQLVHRRPVRLAEELVWGGLEFKGATHQIVSTQSSWHLTNLSYQVPPRVLKLSQKCSCIAVLPCEARAMVCWGLQLWL